MSEFIMERRDRAMNSNVFIVDTSKGKYVVKLKNGQITEQDYAEKEILDKLEMENIPKVLLLKKYGTNIFVKVIKYINGKHVYGILSDKQYEALLESEHQLGYQLERVYVQNFPINNLKERLDTIYKESKNKYVKVLVTELLHNENSSQMGEYVLSHNDLNRDNILFEEYEGEKVRANIIDFESLEYAPKDYQFASMLASGILLEGGNINQIKQTILMRGKNLDRILYLMQIRTLEGLHFFIEKNDKSNLKENPVVNDFIKRYFIANRTIEFEREKIRERKDCDEEIFYR